MKNAKKANPVKNVVTSKASDLIASSTAKYLRIGPRKLRVVIDTVRWKPTEKAFAILSSLKNKGARMTEKVLKSACANAKVLGMDESRLIVSEIRADGGPMMKRFLSRSMGRADRILKRMSHLSIKVKEGRGTPGNQTVAAEVKKEEGSKAAKSKTSAKNKSAKAAKA